ncbi:hypothetical protein BT63DRAFT_465781 [Microthyrium microscopicum]|uniref:Uncharacterized protein n=1 Tax=Microthyrium microscopicum TaxID=703497 RepID=A0A6A6TVV0_9PEZI|nr:hypothetical protein BT63DRAFT_465781 [Microthyrium microscopicum]
MPVITSKSFLTSHNFCSLCNIVACQAFISQNKFVASANVPDITSKSPLAHQHDNSLVKRQSSPQTTVSRPTISIGKAASEFIKISMVQIAGYPPKDIPINGQINLFGGLFYGTNSSQGDTIQTVIEGYGSAKLWRTCRAYPGQWCIRSHAIHGCCLFQASPDSAIINHDDQVLIEYEKADGLGGMWTQSLWNLGPKGVDKKELWKFTKGNAPTKLLSIRTETDGGVRGSADIQNYLNITMTMATEEPKLAATLVKKGNVHVDNMTTADGGRTWVIREIAILPMLEGQAFSPD